MAEEATDTGATLDTAAASTAEPTTTAETGGSWIDSVPEDVRSSEQFTSTIKDAEAYRSIEKVPETSDGYKIEGMEAEALKEFGEFAHSLGMTQGQAEKFHSVMAEKMQQASDARKASLEAARETLKTDSKTTLDKTYGKEAPQVESVSRQAMQKWGDPELIETLEKTGLIYHPSVISAFYRIGSLTQPDIIVPGNVPGKQPEPVDKSGKVHVEYQTQK